MKYFKSILFLLFVFFFLLNTAVFPADEKGSGENWNNIFNADEYFQKGFIFFNNGDYDSAIDSWEKALAYYRNSNEKVKESVTFSNLGSAYDEKGIYVKAVEYYGKSITISEETGNDILKSDTLTNIGVSYWKLKEFEKALTSFEEAASIDEKLQREESLALNLLNSAKVYREQGKINDAIRAYEKAISLYKKTGNEDAIANENEMPGILRREEDKNKEAADNSLELIKNEERTDGYEESGKLFKGILSMADENSADSPEKKMEVDNQGKQSSAEIKIKEDIIEETIVPIDIPEKEIPSEEKVKKEKKVLTAEEKYQAGIESELKSIYTGAIESYEEALELWNEDNGEALKSDILLRLGTLYLINGRANSAALLKESLAIKEEINDIAGKGLALEAMGRSFLSSFRLPEAMENFNIAFAIFDAENNAMMKSFLNIDIADSYLRSAMYKKADDYYERALQDGITAGNPSIMWRAKYGKAKSLYARKLPEEALPLIIEAIGLSEKEAGNSLTIFLPDNKKQNIADDIVDILVELYMSKNDIKYAETAFLYSEISSYNRTFPPSVASPKDIAGENYNLLSLHSVRKLAILDDNEIFLKYIFRESYCFVFVVLKKEFQLIKLPLAATEIMSLVNDLISPVMKVEALGIGKWVNKSLHEFDLDKSNKLYDILIAPISEHLEGKALLMISSGGAFSGFPFEALVSKKGVMRKDPSVIFSEYEDSRYLVDDYDVIYSPVAILLSPDESPEKSFKYSFCATGGEKPDFFSDLKNIFTGENESRYINLTHNKDKTEELSDCTIIQIISPVNIDYDNIQKSIIEIEDEERHSSADTETVSKNRGEKSFLVLSSYADEMVMQEESLMKRPLIIPLFGNNILYPLWNVNEEIKYTFLKEFYKNLVSNNFNHSRGEVARLAKKKLKGIVLKNSGSPHSVSLSHPYFWANFIQSGR